MSARDWHAEEVQAASVLEAQCAMFVGGWLFGGFSRCENAATVHQVCGCVHEHVWEQNVCDRCAEGMAAKQNYCNSCTDGDESHECPITMTTTGIAVSA